MRLRLISGGHLRWGSALLLAVCALLVLGSSAGSAGNLGDLVFTTTARTITAGGVSEVITVERQNSGDAVSTGETTINLTSDSTKGAFRDAVTGDPITSVPIHDGSSTADFKYYDETAGSPKITATDALGDDGFGSVDQTETVNPGPATHFSVTAPSVDSPAHATAGTAFSVSVTARDSFENIATGYLGTIHFTSSDTKGTTVLPTPDYPFVAGDNGTHSFPDGVSLTTTGSQSVSATDTSDGSITGSDSIDVAPGPLDHFTIATPTVVPSEAGIAARAGHDSNATMTAYDQFDNIKTDYNPAAVDVTLSGDLSNSSTGCPQSPATPCAPIYSGTGYGVGAFTNGVATATFRPFQKEGSRHLTVTDTALNKTNVAMTAFAVKAGDLDHFTVGAPSPAPQAGYNSSVSITAYDAFGNVKDDYAGGATLAGTLSSSTTGFSCSVGSPCNPTYSALSFSGGTATGTFQPVVATEPGSAPTSEVNRTVTVSDGPTHTGTSPTFNVLPGDPKTLTFVNQPQETCAARVPPPPGIVCASDPTKTAIINGTPPLAPFVRVLAQDTYGNNAYNTSVNLAIATGFNPGSTTLQGTLTRATNSGGVAIFDDLSIRVVGIGYKLVANAPPASPTAVPKNSTAFNIAQTVTSCTSSACAGSATDQPNSVVTVNGTGQNLFNNTLGIALAGNGPPIPTVCDPNCHSVCANWSAAPNYPASYIDVNATVTAGPQPTLTITWKIPKSVVTKIPNIPNNTNNGASHYDICLGSVNLAHPDGVGVTPWPTKDGGTAKPVLDTSFGVVFFWGIIPDCPKKGTIVNPCMQSRNKDSLGNLMLTYITPYPWDPSGWAGGHI
jgi:hypothetical protein